jgi:hypothetical protein
MARKPYPSDLCATEWDARQLAIPKKVERTCA